MYDVEPYGVGIKSNIKCVSLITPWIYPSLLPHHSHSEICRADGNNLPPGRRDQRTNTSHPGSWTTTSNATSTSTCASKAFTTSSMLQQGRHHDHTAHKTCGCEAGFYYHSVPFPRVGGLAVSPFTVCADWLASRTASSHPAAAQSTARARCPSRRPSPSCC